MKTSFETHHHIKPYDLEQRYVSFIIIVFIFWIRTCCFIFKFSFSSFLQFLFTVFQFSFSFF